ncbi:MAG TPA: aldo/keto reductase [Kiloniellaceae bacterium]|nr:aldo/keto reductase [Kiloniellaceae bacterium]
MQKRQLGRNGPQVSAIGIGAMSFTDFYGPTTKAASFDILHAALDLGIDHIDTANVYGRGLSEETIGAFLAEQGGACPFTIATKAGIARDPDSGKTRFDNSPAHLATELEGSLKRLGLEAVDLFYVHRRDQTRPIEEVTETLAGLVKAGKTKSIGFSEIAPSSLRRAAAVYPVAAVQSEYSLSTRTPEIGLVQACEALGAALVAFSPVGRGLLTDQPPTADSVAASGFLKSNPRFSDENLSANLRESDRLRSLAADMGRPAAALAIAWLLQHGPHVIPIPGTRSVAHLRELAAGAELRLTAADVARIEDALPIGWAYGDRYSTAQWAGPERYA